MKSKTLLSLMAVSVVCAQTAGAQTYDEPLGPSQSDFGGAGLLQTPTARIPREGEFSANYRDNDVYRFYSLSMALFPWLETTLRYTDVRNRLYSNDPNFSGSQTYKDKSFDVKLRLWEEGYYLPQVSVGKRDIGGTGLFDSEYLVASKAAGPFDFTLGMGWGYLGNSGNITNPFCKASDKYCTRATSHSTGDISLDDMFHGPAGLFGGVEYQTPWQPLRLKVEYDGNNYQDDFAGALKQNSKINVGAVYRLTSWMDVNASYERGNTFMFGFTLRNNLNDWVPHQIDEPVPAYAPQQQSAGIVNYSVAAGQLADLKGNAGFSEPRIDMRDNTLNVTGQQDKYRDTTRGVDRANVIMLNNLPANVDTLEVTQNRFGMPMVTTKTPVAALRQQQQGYPLGHEQPLAQQRVEPVTDIGQGFFIGRERFNYSLSPVLRQSVGGPESFYMYQVGALADANYWLTDHLLIDGGVFANIANNYDKFRYNGVSNDSSLPRVRTHIREYVENDVYVNNLQANYFRYLGNGFYGQLYGGYLEMMYGGAGGEVLYRPLDSDWAFGIDANYVKQRDWDDMMRFTNYKAATGNLTAYWRPEFMDNVLVKMSVGQYLAKDKGGTLDLSKRFDSGVTVGAYATLTNVSKDEYGEGSFTKGFYISVPLDLLTVRPTRSTPTISWTPLTRDGGQMLGRQYGLYGITSDRDTPQLP
ncbi:YjbH domain-containing protein [Rahnella victoriana]|uniref:YjbH domain-containing protein n=1 Tax=Rahnella victoriana TaxID=1510570 RepID=UPI001E565BA2|nr:YjbH domain-containing protein [Rahnella victoriana]UHM91448.1 YjbH domain-containing protein [Rahnella victoriana]